MRIAAFKRYESLELLEKLSKGQSSGIQIEVTDIKKKYFYYLPCD